MACSEKHEDRRLAIKILKCFGVAKEEIANNQATEELVQLVTRHRTK